MTNLLVIVRLILPAHAGMILADDAQFEAEQDITRTCGDDPGDCLLVYTSMRYYPHMRG